MSNEEISNKIDYALKNELKYSVQYVDDKNSWTVPVKLNKERAERVINDNSISAIRIFYPDATLVLNP